MSFPQINITNVLKYIGLSKTEPTFDVCDEKVLIEISRIFSKKIQKVFFESEKNNDIILSPISILLCSILLYPGMSGNTKKQFDDLFFEVVTEVKPKLNLSKTFLSDNFDLVLDAYLNISKTLTNSFEDESSEIRICNRAYMHETFGPLDSFTDLMNKMSSLRKINLLGDRNKACDIINTQIEEDTNNNIKNLLKPEMLEDSILVLVNALYFKSDWLYSFTNVTKMYGMGDDLLEFRKSDGDVVRLNRLIYSPQESHTMFPTFEDEYVKAVTIPLKAENYGMMIIVPKDGVDLKNVDVQNLLSANVEMKDQFCQVEMPVWSQRTKMDLKPIFEKLGMVDMFIPRTANFEKILPDPNIYLSNAIHESFVEVTETGVKAAGATAFVLSRKSFVFPPEPTFIIKADRTFAWYIYNMKNKMPLFQGVYDGSV